MIQIFQTIASGSALLIGITYLIGGLIVNLNLARKGVLEYQILKVKYLVVGLIFLLQSAGLAAIAGLVGFGLLALNIPIIFVQIVNLASMLAALSLLFFWQKYTHKGESFFTDWSYWAFAGAMGMVFPMMILARFLLQPLFDPLSILYLVQAAMTGVLAFLAQIFHYSSFYYGQVSFTKSVDPIGMGIPIPIKIAGETAKLKQLKGLGVPVKAGITDELHLIDETDKHYIVSFTAPATEETPAHERTLKISKDMVDAILFKPGQEQA